MTNTVAQQPAAVSLQLSDLLLGYQSGQSPSTRSVTIGNLGSYYAALAGATFTGEIQGTAGINVTSGATFDNLNITNAGTVVTQQVTGVQTVGTLISQFGATIDAGGLQVVLGGLGVTAGGLTVGGGATITGNTTIAAGNLVVPAADVIDLSGGAGTISISGASSEFNMFVGTVNAAALTSSAFQAGLGYEARSGSGGSYDGHTFNVHWTGAAAQLYIDNSLQGSFAYTSDRRIKKNIEPFAAGALSRVMSLVPVHYEYRDIDVWRGDGRRWDGFIADELQKVIPSAVDGDAGALNSDGTLRTQTLNLLPMLANAWAAIRELADIVSAQAVRIDALESLQR